MSVESARDFIQKVKVDEDFRNQLNQLTDSQARLAFAKKAGFDFTADDIARAKEEQGLTDEELDGVAGGCGHICLPIQKGDISFN